LKNSYFQFKQFTIQQDACAMKVCTDACLFGAWLAEKKHLFNNDSQCLDIGTGTGLLALMIAQKNTTNIDAVEIDVAAATQAQQNIQDAAFNKKIQVFNQPIQNFLSQNASKKYDFIFSNPPFYEADLPTNNNKKNVAMHSTALGLKSLIELIAEALLPNGKTALLLPAHRENKVLQYCLTNNLFPTEICYVQQTEKHTAFRIMLLISKVKTTEARNFVTIKINNQYSSAFASLLQHYYLHL